MVECCTLWTGLKVRFFYLFFFFFLTLIDDRGGSSEARTNGRSTEEEERWDFSRILWREIDYSRLVGIVTRLRCEMSGYEAELLGIVDGSWLLFARQEFVQSMGKRDVLV